MSDTHVKTEIEGEAKGADDSATLLVETDFGRAYVAARVTIDIDGKKTSILVPAFALLWAAKNVAGGAP